MRKRGGNRCAAIPITTALSPLSTRSIRMMVRPIARPTHLADDILTSHDAVDIKRENQRDNDTDRYVLAAQSRQVAGAAER